MKKIFKVIFISLFLIGLTFTVTKFSPVRASTLILNPPFSTVEKGNDLKVDVILNGENELIDGVDVILKYDTNVLAVKSIKEGSFFGKYPLKRDDGGQIKITALAPKDGVKIFGDISIATIVFDILDNGQTKLNFDFEKDSSKDSNVALHSTGQDSLSSVTNGSYTVTATPEKAQKAAAKKSQGVPSPLIIFILLLLIIAGGVYYYLKKRKPKQDFFVPEPFPMDETPKSE